MNTANVYQSCPGKSVPDKQMKDTIIVTGGAGFIGSALVWALNNAGEDKIHIVDSLGCGEKWKNIAPLRFSDYQEKEEFLNSLLAGKWKGGVKTIFHLGACSSTTEGDVAYLIKNNFEYTKQLAAYCRTAGIRFIYASSAATYGDGSAGFKEDPAGLVGLCPLNAYAFSKHLFDLWALKNGILDSIAGLKYFNVYGPNEYHKGDMRSMVIKGFEQIRETGKIRLFMSYRDGYRDGGQQRDFIYVKDAVDMTLFFHTHPHLQGIFNVGSGEANTWNTLAVNLFEAMGKQPRIQYISMPDDLKGRYQYYTRADISRLREAGYDRSLTPFKEAVFDYVQNYLIPGEYLSS